MNATTYTSEFFSFRLYKKIFSIKPTPTEPIYKVELINGQFKIVETKWISSYMESKFGNLTITSGSFLVNLIPFDISQCPIYAALNEAYQKTTSASNLIGILGKINLLTLKHLQEHLQREHDIVLNSNEVQRQNAIAIDVSLANLSPCVNHPHLWSILEKHTARMFLMVYPSLTSKTRMHQIFLVFRFLLTSTHTHIHKKIKVLFDDFGCSVLFNDKHRMYEHC